MDKFTYISLFSSAGVGCYGFKQENFECIATNELLPKRIQVQKYNKKCKYESGYICGDILKKETIDKIHDEIQLWKDNEHLKDITTIIATLIFLLKPSTSVQTVFKNALTFSIINVFGLISLINFKDSITNEFLACSSFFL